MKQRKASPAAMVGYGFVLLLLLLTTAFIWSNSLRNAAASTEQSGSFRALFARLFDVQQEPFRFLYENMRKVAHFSEFALLGAEAAILPAVFEKKRLRRLALAWLFCVLVAAVDETIQYFVPGRAAAVADVALDSAGALCGLCLSALLVRLLCRIFKKK